MDKIAIVGEEDESLKLYLDCSEYKDETTSETATYFSKRNPRLVNFVLKGTMLLSVAPISNQVVGQSQIVEKDICDLEQTLRTYNDCIELPFSEFLNKVSKSNYKFYIKEVVRDILSFKSLKEKWDGYQSVPLEVESAANAIDLIHTVGESFTKNLSDFFPNPHGTISFEWENSSGENISVEVGNSNMSYYVDLNSQPVLFKNDIDINDKEISTLSEYINIL